ncbi:MAG: secretin N-terminal domain-containing protein [Planctomycetaceae bacterium]
MSRTRILSLVALLAVGVVGADVALAQQRRRGSVSVVFSCLRDKRVVSEIKIPEASRKRIAELYAKATFTPGQYRPFLNRIDAARSEDQKRKIRDEMSQASRVHRKKYEQDALKLLDDKQRERFWQLRFRLRGTSEIVTEEAVKRLKITDGQKAKLGSLLRARGSAYLRRSRDERRDEKANAAFNADWDAKTLAVLTPSQRDQWKTMLGPPLAGSPENKTNDSPTKTDRTPTPRKPVADANGRFIASFDGNGTSPIIRNGGGVSSRKTVSKSGEKREFSFSFENAPWRIVLEYFAKKANMTLDSHELPPDTFNYRDPNRYSLTEALDVINGYLIPKSFILVRRDKFLVVHNLQGPVPPSIVPDVSLEDLPKRGRNELMRVSFTLKADVDVREQAKELEDMVNKTYGKVLSFNAARRIIVTDIGTNLQRIATLLKDVSKVPKEGDLAFRAFGLQYIAAVDAEKLVSEQLNAQKKVTNVSFSASGGGGSSGDPRERFRRMMAMRFGRGGRSGGDRGRGGSSGSTGRSSRTTGDANVRVNAEPRTNSLFVLASIEKVKLAEEIVKALDVPMSPGRNPFPPSRNSEPYLKSYKVRGVTATEVTKTLSVLLPEGSVINEDGRAGTIHIFGNDEIHKMAEELIEEMGGTGGGSVDIVPVKYNDPAAVAATLVAMFASDGSSAPSIQADSRGRQLLVRGTKSQIAQIKTLVTRLEANSTARSWVSDQDGPVRRFDVPGDPQEFLRNLQQMMRGNTKNPIRIVVPNGSGPIRERRLPGRGLESPNNDDSRRRLPRRTTTERRLWRDAPYRRPLPGVERVGKVEGRPRKPAAGELFAMYSTDDRGARRLSADAQRQLRERAVAQKPPSETEPKTTAKTPAPTGPPVTIFIQNGQIVVNSDDKQALDRIQRLIGAMAASYQPKTTWTVFYLQSADATEAASMLEQLLPSSTVATTASSSSNSLFGGLTQGFSSLGNTVADMSGLNTLSDSVRIIPDVRSNALFVSGSAAKVRDVERMLKVLDSSDLPANLRDRVPRMVPVRYADVNEVASIVRDVYSDYMQPTQSRGGGANNFNPLAMIMTGGRSGRSRGSRNSGGNSRQQQGVRLTLGVDQRTGQLIVSANDALYQQIEQMVYDLDKSAYQAERTTRVIHLKNASTSTITQTLTAMYPNISVTGSLPGTNRSGSNSRGQTQPQRNTPGGSNNNSDALRRMMQFRALMRAQGAGRGGGTPGGRGGSTGFGGFGRGGRPSGFGGFGRGGRPGGFGGLRSGRGGRGR